MNQITGLKPNDLNSINGLNHYIGMQAIEPDAIPELRFMPWILAAAIVAGLLVALVGRRGCSTPGPRLFAARRCAGLVRLLAVGLRRTATTSIRTRPSRSRG